MWLFTCFRLPLPQQRASHRRARSPACRTCPQRRCATALPPPTAACWTPRPRRRPRWPPRPPQPPPTPSRPSPCPSPPSLRDELTTPTTSPCQAKPLPPPAAPHPPHPPPLPPLAHQVTPACRSTWAPWAASPPPCCPGPSPSPPCPPPCSPQPPPTTRQLCIPIMPCYRHSPSLWLPNRRIESKCYYLFFLNKRKKNFLQLYIAFYLFIDIRQFLKIVWKGIIIGQYLTTSPVLLLSMKQSVFFCKLPYG